MARPLRELIERLADQQPADTITTVNVLGAEWDVVCYCDDDEESPPRYSIDAVRIGGAWFAPDMFVPAVIAALNQAVTGEFRADIQRQNDDMALAIAGAY